jgi:hypothetical protein
MLSKVHAHLDGECNLEETDTNDNFEDQENDDE